MSMTDANTGIEFGTCSWNYDSWTGLVYSGKKSRSAEYLPEYSEKYNTAEIDSWFYKLPEAADAKEYRSLTPEGFSFACKITESISLTHERTRTSSVPLKTNPEFLSVDAYADYIKGTEAIRSRIFLAELEFEYLNKQKMSGAAEFLKALERFVDALEAKGLKNALPLGVECRNANYLTRDYFKALRDFGVAHVFSEKQYLPHIYELYDKNSDLVGERTAIRLLGGDRKEIEAKTKGVWNTIIEPKKDLPEIAAMLRDLSEGSRLVKAYFNNHYEGSAPLSIERIKALL